MKQRLDDIIIFLKNRLFFRVQQKCKCALMKPFFTLQKLKRTRVTLICMSTSRDAAPPKLAKFRGETELDVLLRVALPRGDVKFVQILVVSTTSRRRGPRRDEVAAALLGVNAPRTPGRRLASSLGGTIVRHRPRARLRVDCDAGERVAAAAVVVDGGGGVVVVVVMVMMMMMTLSFRHAAVLRVPPTAP